MITGYLRGHPIYWDFVDEQWRFSDTDEPTLDNWQERPCAHCRKVFRGSDAGDPDPCLGMLPGVSNACCGHGVPGEAYVQFENGVVIRGFDKVEYPCS